jgi:hypothetical protein
MEKIGLDPRLGPFIGGNNPFWRNPGLLCMLAGQFICELMSHEFVAQRTR